MEEEERKQYLLDQPSFAGYGAGPLLRDLHRTHTAVNLIVTYASSMRDGVFGPLNDRQREVLSEILGSGAALAELISRMSEEARQALPGSDDEPPSIG